MATDLLEGLSGVKSVLFFCNEELKLWVEFTDFSLISDFLFLPLSALCVNLVFTHLCLRLEKGYRFSSLPLLVVFKILFILELLFEEIRLLFGSLKFFLENENHFCARFDLLLLSLDLEIQRLSSHLLRSKLLSQIRHFFALFLLFFQLFSEIKYLLHLTLDPNL